MYSAAVSYSVAVGQLKEQFCCVKFLRESGFEKNVETTPTYSQPFYYSNVVMAVLTLSCNCEKVLSFQLFKLAQQLPTGIQCIAGLLWNLSVVVLIL